MSCIPLVIPLCQKRVVAPCKGWVTDPGFSPCILGAVRAASFLFADPMIGCCTPLVATRITEPANTLTALCHHTVRCALVCPKVPLSCNQRSLGSQGVVLAHFVATALRTATASGPVLHSCFPVQVAIWTLVTYPPDLPIALWFYVNVAQVTISSMIPLPL